MATASGTASTPLPPAASDDDTGGGAGGAIRGGAPGDPGGGAFSHAPSGRELARLAALLLLFGLALGFRLGTAPIDRASEQRCADVVDGMLGGMFVKRVADILENWDTDRDF